MSDNNSNDNIILKVEGLKKVFGDHVVLENINTTVKKGEVIAIIGPSGCGKSTFLRSLNLLEKPTEGHIYFHGTDITDKNVNINKKKKKIGMVFQNPENQIIFNNVYDDIAFALKNLELDNEEIRIKTSLEKLRMDKYLKSPTYELSLGQKQRVTIAGVLAVNPKYIIFDEPTTMLDSEGKEDVYEIVKALKKQGYTIIYVTNVMDEILIADRVVVLEKGEIIKEFNKEEILENIEFLEEHEIKIPSLAKMLYEFRKNGIEIKLEEWTKEELTNKIIEVAKKWN